MSYRRSWQSLLLVASDHPATLEESMPLEETEWTRRYGDMLRARGAEQVSGPTPWLPASDALHGLVAPHGGDA